MCNIMPVIIKNILGKFDPVSESEHSDKLPIHNIIENAPLI